MLQDSSVKHHEFIGGAWQSPSGVTLDAGGFPRRTEAMSCVGRIFQVVLYGPVGQKYCMMQKCTGIRTCPWKR